MAEASSPDADLTLPDAAACLREWIVALLARLILLLRAHSLATGHRCASRAPSLFQVQPSLPPLAVHTRAATARAATARGAFDQTVAWMRRCRDIGSGRRYWRERTSTIAAFGGSPRGVRAGLRRCGLPWRETPAITPGMIGMAAGNGSMSLSQPRCRMRVGF